MSEQVEDRKLSPQEQEMMNQGQRKQPLALDEQDGDGHGSDDHSEEEEEEEEEDSEEEHQESRKKEDQDDDEHGSDDDDDADGDSKKEEEQEALSTRRSRRKPEQESWMLFDQKCAAKFSALEIEDLTRAVVQDDMKGRWLKILLSDEYPNLDAKVRTQADLRREWGSIEGKMAKEKRKQEREEKLKKTRKDRHNIMQKKEQQSMKKKAHHVSAFTDAEVKDLKRAMLVDGMKGRWIGILCSNKYKNLDPKMRKALQLRDKWNREEEKDPKLRRKADKARNRRKAQSAETAMGKKQQQAQHQQQQYQQQQQQQHRHHQHQQQQQHTDAHLHMDQYAATTPSHIPPNQGPPQPGPFGFPNQMPYQMPFSPYDHPHYQYHHHHPAHFPGAAPFMPYVSHAPPIPMAPYPPTFGAPPPGYAFSPGGHPPATDTPFSTVETGDLIRAVVEDGMKGRWAEILSSNTYPFLSPYLRTEESLKKEWEKMELYVAIGVQRQQQQQQQEEGEKGKGEAAKVASMTDSASAKADPGSSPSTSQNVATTMPFYSTYNDTVTTTLPPSLTSAMQQPARPRMPFPIPSAATAALPLIGHVHPKKESREKNIGGKAYSPNELADLRRAVVEDGMKGRWTEILHSDRYPHIDIKVRSANSIARQWKRIEEKEAQERWQEWEKQQQQQQQVQQQQQQMAMSPGNAPTINSHIPPPLPTLQPSPLGHAAYSSVYTPLAHAPATIPTTATTTTTSHSIPPPPLPPRFALLDQASSPSAHAPAATLTENAPITAGVDISPFPFDESFS